MGDGSNLLAGGVIGVVVFAVMKLGDWAFEKRKAVRAETEDEWKRLVDAAMGQVTEQGRKIDAMAVSHREEMDAIRKKEEDCRERMGEAVRQYERVYARMGHLEDMLVAAGVKFRPWDESDTAKHAAIPPGEQK